MSKAKKVCKTRACKNTVHARGYCQKCYDKVRKKNAAGSGRARKCKTAGCKHPHHAQGYCQQCYDKVRKTSKEKVSSTASANADDLVCKTDGCKNEHHAKGYCKKCYSRLRRNGTFKAEPEPRRTVTSRADKGRKRGGEPAHAAPDSRDNADEAAPSNRLELLRARLSVLEQEKQKVAKEIDDEGDE